MTEPPAVTDIANLLVAATALIVAVISAVYGWRAYAIQLTSSTPRYFGVVWESPSFFRRRFTAHGYRVRLKWDRDKGIHDDWLEVWNDRTKSWNMMPTKKSTGARSSNPVEEANIVARNLVGQMDIKAKSNKWI